MGIAAEDILADWHASAAALAWQIELGLGDVIGEVPNSAYDLPETSPVRPQGPVRTQALSQAQTPGPSPAPASPPTQTRAEAQEADKAAAIDAAQAAARAATSLADLHRALADFDLCDLKKGARSTVFADGKPGAHVLILGEAPGRDEDIEGRPFAGKSGQLLDRMFAAIGLSRQGEAPQDALYLSLALPWRPAGDREARPDEIALLLPFVQRHIDLAAPRIIVTMGNTPLFALTGQRGITRARGQWLTTLGRPHLPMIPPDYLLRSPEAKREAWADLLSLKARLQQAGTQ